MNIPYDEIIRASQIWADKAPDWSTRCQGPYVHMLLLLLGYHGRKYIIQHKILFPTFTLRSHSVWD